MGEDLPFCCEVIVVNNCSDGAFKGSGSITSAGISSVAARCLRAVLSLNLADHAGVPLRGFLVRIRGHRDEAWLVSVLLHTSVES